MLLETKEPRMKRFTRYLPVLAILGLALVLAIALGPSTGTAYATSAPTITLVAPIDGAVITSSTITVQVAVQNYTLSCPFIGKSGPMGVGHWHLHLDGVEMNDMLTGLVDMECTTQHLLNLQAVAPGWHTLQVVLASSQHMELQNPEAFASIKFYYNPPLPAISIPVPPNGTPVSAGMKFRVQLQVTNFFTSEDYFGKVLIPGFGHWHLYVDGYNSGLAMGNMVDMGGGTTDWVDTTGLAPGPHTLWARLVDNYHMPLNMDLLYPQPGDTYYPNGYPDIVSAPVTFIVQ
jgi:hypothetical protein